MAYQGRMSYKRERWRGGRGRGRDNERGRGRGRGRDRGRGYNRRGRGRGGYNHNPHYQRQSNAAWNMLDSYPGKKAFSFIKLTNDQILTVPVNNFGKERDPSYVYKCKLNKWEESTLKQHVQSPIAMCIDPKCNDLYIYGRNKIEQKDSSELAPYGLYKINMENNSMELLTDTDLQDTIGTIVSLFFIDNKLHLFTDSLHAIYYLQCHRYKHTIDSPQPLTAPPKQCNCHLIWNSVTKQFDVAHKFGEMLRSGYTATYIEDKQMIVILSDPDIYELDLSTNKICKLELKMPRVIKGKGNDSYNTYDPYTGSHQVKCRHIAALSDNQRFMIVYDKYLQSDELWIYNVEKRFFKKSGIKRPANGYPVIVSGELHLIIGSYQTCYTIHEYAQAYHEYWQTYREAVQMLVHISDITNTETDEEIGDREIGAYSQHQQEMEGIINNYEAVLVAPPKSVHACNHFAMEITQIIPGYLSQKKRETQTENDKEKIQRLEEQIKHLKYELNKKENIIQQLRADNDKLRKQKTLNPLNYANWKYQDIVDWIISLNENKYARYRHTLTDNMRNEEIDGSCLDSLTVDDLHRFGIRAFKDKQQILKQIKILICNQNPQNDNEGQGTLYM